MHIALSLERLLHVLPQLAQASCVGAALLLPPLPLRVQLGQEATLGRADARGGSCLDRMHDLGEFAVPALLPRLHPALKEPRRRRHERLRPAARHTHNAGRGSSQQRQR